MDQMKTTAGILKKVLFVVRIVLIVVTALAVAAAVTAIATANLIVPLWRDAGASATVNIGGLSWQVSTLNPTAGAWRTLFGVAIPLLLVVVAFVWIGIVFLEAILNDTAKGQPFSPEQPRRIRRLAVLAFVASVVTPLAPAVLELYVYRFFGIAGLVSSSGAGVTVDPGFSYSINLLAVFVGFVLLLLAYVFDYGSQLQIQSDETL